MSSMSVSQIQKNSLITAIKTPFNQNGKVDIDRYNQLVEQQIKHGVDGLVVGGTTGEGHLLDWEEHLMLIAHTAKHFGDQLLVIGNTGSNNTREALKATQSGFASGMHAALQINPYYGRTTMEGVYQHLSRVLDLGPAFIYNVPGRTGQDISTDIVQRLAEKANFVGVKECAGNERIAQYEKQGIACWSGNDDECFDGRHQHNSHGVISVSSNIVPGLMRQLMDNAETESQAINQQLKLLYTWLFDEPNPAPLNTALSLTGAIDPIIRLPYLALNKEKREILKSILTDIGFEHVTGTQWLNLTDKDFISII